MGYVKPRLFTVTGRKRKYYSNNKRQNKYLLAQIIGPNQKINWNNNIRKDIEQVDCLGGHSRRKYFALGISKVRQGNWKRTQWKVAECLRDNFNMQPDSKCVYRIGQAEQGITRVILACFHGFLRCCVTGEQKANENKHKNLDYRENVHDHTGSKGKLKREIKGGKDQRAGGILKGCQGS